jgi:hypothetical protein
MQPKAMRLTFSPDVPKRVCCTSAFLYRGISIGFRVARDIRAATTGSTSDAAQPEGVSGNAEADVAAAHRQMIRGMLERNTDLLEELLDESYALEHITGYVQPKREWIADIGSGRMRYHSEQERSTSAEVTGDNAVLVGRSVVDATIRGSRGTWDLQLTTQYERIDGRWVAMRTVARTY